MKAYSYIRFSTPEQAKGDSRRRQTDLAARWLAANPGYTLDTELNMKDLGVSAFKGGNMAETAALGAFVKAIEDGIVDKGSVLLVESLDRISRQMQRKALHIVEGIVEAGIDVVTLGDNKRWDLKAINGFDWIMAFAVLFRAHEESATKASRKAANWEMKRAGMLGKKPVISTSRVPAWINVTGAANKASGHNAKLSLNADRVKIIKRIYREFNAGAGTSGIARNLNEEKVPAFGGNFWAQVYVAKILRWRAVLGEFTPCVGGEPQAAIPDYYPRAIDDDVFEAAQALRESKQGRMPRSQLLMNILTKLGACPKCGSSMRRKQGGKKRNGAPPQPKLVCSRADHGVGCDHVTVDLTDIETAFKQWDVKIPRRDASLDDALKALEQGIAGLESQCDNLVEAIAARPSAALSKRLAEYEARLERNADELAALQKQAGESDGRVLKKRAQQLREALSAKEMDRSEVNVRLRTMLSKVVIEYATAELVLHWKHDGVTRLEYGDMAAREFIDFTKKKRA